MTTVTQEIGCRCRGPGAKANELPPPPGRWDTGTVTGVVEQSYCDWCYGPLADEDGNRSRSVGLDMVDTWACVRCIDSGQIAESPDGWEGPGRSRSRIAAGCP